MLDIFNAFLSPSSSFSCWIISWGVKRLPVAGFTSLNLIWIVLNPTPLSARTLISFSVKTYFKEVIFMSILVLIIAAIVPFFVSIIFEQGILRFLIVGFSSVIALFFTIFYIGIAKKDKNLIVSKIHIVIKKYKNGINFN